MERQEEGVVVRMRGRVEIDTRKPFRSVKEAVMLFGEKLLAADIHAKHLKEEQNKAERTGGQNQQRKFGGIVRVELEETKENLQKAKEEGTFMAHCLQSLKEELELTRREIQQLKTREVLPHHQKEALVDPEIEEIKFIEQPIISSKTKTGDNDDDDDDEIEFEKKRSVKFASPPLLTKVIMSNEHVKKLEGETSPSQLKNKKLKRKPLIPLIGALFSKKKGNQE